MTLIIQKKKKILTVAYSAMVSLCSSSAVPDTSSSASFLRTCSWVWSCWTLKRVWASSTKLCSTSSQASCKNRFTNSILATFLITIGKETHKKIFLRELAVCLLPVRGSLLMEIHFPPALTRPVADCFQSGTCNYNAGLCIF